MDRRAAARRLAESPATTKPGALASLRPRVHIPRAARATFMAVTPVNIASWSLGGFYFSLMPSVVRAATGTTLPIVGGLVIYSLAETWPVRCDSS